MRLFVGGFFCPGGFGIANLSRILSAALAECNWEDGAREDCARPPQATGEGDPSSPPQSPWATLDPQVIVTYYPGSTGAALAWKGHFRVGEGSIEKTGASSVQSHEFAWKLVRPCAAAGTMTFWLSPTKATRVGALYFSSTRVLWIVEGTHSFCGKALSLLGGMDRFVGSDLTRGIALLDEVVLAEARKRGVAVTGFPSRPAERPLE